VAYALQRASGQANTPGNTTLVTPPPGKLISIHYISYNPKAPVEVGFRFGENGQLFLRNDLVGLSVIAKDTGDMHSIDGGVDEPLILNLSAAVVTNWTVFYLLV
jgi:hypothetical protein